MTEPYLNYILCTPSREHANMTFYVSKVELSPRGTVERVLCTPLRRLALRLTYSEASLLLEIIPDPNLTKELL